MTRLTPWAVLGWRIEEHRYRAVTFPLPRSKPTQKDERRDDQPYVTGPLGSRKCLRIARRAHAGSAPQLEGMRFKSVCANVHGTTFGDRMASFVQSGGETAARQQHGVAESQGY